MASRRAKLTITQVFALTFCGVAVVVGALFLGLLESSRKSLVERSERFREAAAARIDTRITRDLGEAADVLTVVENSSTLGPSTRGISALGSAALLPPLGAPERRGHLVHASDWVADVRLPRSGRPRKRHRHTRREA